MKTFVYLIKENLKDTHTIRTKKDTKAFVPFFLYKDSLSSSHYLKKKTFQNQTKKGKGLKPTIPIWEQINNTKVKVERLPCDAPQCGRLLS